MPHKEWHYGFNGQRIGPIPHDEMGDKIRKEIIIPGTLVWREGMSEWKMANQTELKVLFPTPQQSEQAVPAVQDKQWRNRRQVNNSGQGEFADVPLELEQKGFHWGAFVLAPLWALCHGQYGWAVGTFVLNFLLFIPGVIVSAVMASQAYKLAWKGRRWENIDQCLEVQKAWTRMGLIIVLTPFILLVILPFILYLLDATGYF